MLSRLIKIPGVVLPKAQIFTNTNDLNSAVETNGKQKLPRLELTKQGKREAGKKTVVIRM